MSERLLPSLEIHGFRAFDHLAINNLGSVNLFVGKNNVGKSSVLEAIWIYANQGSPLIIRTLLAGRDEIGREDPRLRDDAERQIVPIRYLFHGRREMNEIREPIIIGPIDTPDKWLKINFQWYVEIIDKEQSSRRLQTMDNYNNLENLLPGISIQYGNGPVLKQRLDRLYSKRFPEEFEQTLINKCVFVPANGLSPDDIERFWDNITLTAQEDDVLKSLQIIEPTVNRINIVGASQGRFRRDRIPLVRVSDVDSPIPLRSLGEGMNRIFGIALAVANAKGGILLIDEIESGLHYSIQLDIWQFLFKIAKLLNVEVFATTHSWDCVEAFQKASQDSEEEGFLIRLENKFGNVTPTIFNEKKLFIATREEIEVR